MNTQNITRISLGQSTNWSLATPIPLPDGYVYVDSVGCAMPRAAADILGVPEPGHDPFFAPRFAIDYVAIDVARTPDAARPPYCGGCKQLKRVKPEWGGGYSYSVPDEWIAERLDTWVHDKRWHDSGCPLTGIENNPRYELSAKCAGVPGVPFICGRFLSIQYDWTEAQITAAAIEMLRADTVVTNDGGQLAGLKFAASYTTRQDQRLTAPPVIECATVITPPAETLAYWCAVAQSNFTSDQFRRDVRDAYDRRIENEMREEDEE